MGSVDQPLRPGDSPRIIVQTLLDHWQRASEVMIVGYSLVSPSLSKYEDVVRK